MIEKNVDVDSDGVIVHMICVQIVPVLLFLSSPFHHLLLADNSLYWISALETSNNCFLTAIFLQYSRFVLFRSVLLPCVIWLYIVALCKFFGENYLISFNVSLNIFFLFP